MSVLKTIAANLALALLYYASGAIIVGSVWLIAYLNLWHKWYFLMVAVGPVAILYYRPQVPIPADSLPRLLKWVLWFFGSALAGLLITAVTGKLLCRLAPHVPVLDDELSWVAGWALGVVVLVVVNHLCPWVGTREERLRGASLISYEEARKRGESLSEKRGRGR